jgi:hypothetical protein
VVVSEERKAAGYSRQPCVQPFLFGHKLHFLIVKGLFLDLDERAGESSTRISAG